MRRRRWLLLPALGALSGCADLTAVSTFSKSAPDVAQLDKLTDIYVEDPILQASWISLSQPAGGAPIALAKTRLEQKAAFDQLHGLIVNYMSALGDISGAKVTDLSAQSKVVSGNLSALQKQKIISATSDQVSAIGDFVTLVPQNFLNLHRGHQVAKIIKGNQKAFDAAIDVEISIVNEVYLLDYKATSDTITSQRDYVENAPSWPGTTSLTPAVKFLFEREVQADVGRLARAQTAANQYVVALQQLKVAYDALVLKDGQFDDKTLLAILPYLSAASKAYTDVNAI